MSQAPWITVVGIGDNGLDGISPAARALIDGAELLVGGERHQAMVTGHGAERLTWSGGTDAAMDAMAAWRGRRVVVLATGDPLYYGAGSILARRFRAEEMLVLPHPGAFSLAAARMLWSLPDTTPVTVHGRPLGILNLHVAPGVRLLILSRDGGSPAEIAALLTERGFGPSTLSVFEHLGGPREHRVDGVAETWGDTRTADLNTVAVECRPGPAPRLIPRTPGLPDDLFEHDGQITKREVRAVTISALEPQAGAVLWDVGAGNGSVGIEWLRAAPPVKVAVLDHAEAACVAFERDPDRCARIARNADALGVPQLRVVPGAAPEALAGAEPRPDVVFVGGGITHAGVLEACWDALRPGGLLVANGVTLQAESRLLAARQAWGGSVVRLTVEREDTIGAMAALKPLAPVLQYRVRKP
ncbi:MAG: precorrin-6y C5,15-methyltransferase (decarboxylating) subunit CbiE [Rhodobacterales bacterium]|nr:precorrin-6y C5,15-methyltransferase (decarboxylating) subunit CbiE [Rhodobacterales bacterium]